MSDHLRDIAEGVMRLRFALQEMGGRSPSRIVVDQTSADAILHLSAHDEPFLDHSDRSMHEPSWLATICGVEFHAEAGRHDYIGRSLRSTLSDTDSTDH